MQDKHNVIKQNAENEIANIESTKDLNDLKAKYVGKNGEVTALLRGMKDIPAEERASFGKMVNDLKVEITEMFSAKENELKNKEMMAKFDSEAIDITLPGKTPLAATHPRFAYTIIITWFLKKQAPKHQC